VGLNVKTRIAGVELSELMVIPSEKGAVLHMVRADAPWFTDFGEVYFSEILPGAVKAWKKHRSMTQRLAVPLGRVRFVIEDARPGSITEGVREEFTLDRVEGYALLVIPPGVWYGFQGLAEAVSIVANCADLPHSPEESESLAVGSDGVPTFSWDPPPSDRGPDS